MDIERIQSIIEESTSTILSAGSFSERLNVVSDILDKAFPQASVAAAIYGPITSLTDCVSRIEIGPLLQILKKSSESGHKYLSTDSELNSVLEYIYKIVEE